MEHLKGLNNAQNLHSQSPEPIISVQLLPQDSGLLLHERTSSSRDKNPAPFASVNNFIKKTYAILQEKRF